MAVMDDSVTEIYFGHGIDHDRRVKISSLFNFNTKFLYPVYQPKVDIQHHPLSPQDINRQSKHVFRKGIASFLIG